MLQQLSEFGWDVQIIIIFFLRLLAVLKQHLNTDHP
jgi:hypothetical protein